MKNKEETSFKTSNEEKEALAGQDCALLSRTVVSGASFFHSVSFFLVLVVHILRTIRICYHAQY